MQLSILLFLCLWQWLSNLPLLKALMFNNLTWGNPAAFVHPCLLYSFTDKVSGSFIYHIVGFPGFEAGLFHCKCVPNLLIQPQSAHVCTVYNSWLLWMPYSQKKRMSSKVRTWVLTKKLTAVKLFCLQVIEKMVFLTSCIFPYLSVSGRGTAVCILISTTSFPLPPAFLQAWGGFWLAWFPSSCWLLTFSILSLIS